jgi:hypothetical protein
MKHVACHYAVSSKLSANYLCLIFPWYCVLKYSNLYTCLDEGTKFHICIKQQQKITGL